MPFVKVGDVQVHYRVPSCRDNSDVIDDKKPTMVLLHPRFFDSSFFAPQCRDSRLAQEYNLVTLDHHYHGKTRAPLDDKPYDLNRVAQDMLSAMNVLKIRKAHILGLSLGSQIAVVMQTLAPERVLSLILCGLLPEVETQENIEQYLFLRDACCERDDDGSDRLPSDVVHGLHWIYFGEEDSSQALIDEWVATSNFKPSNRNLVMKIFSAVLDHKPIDPKSLAAIKCPVLVIHGANDVACSEEIAKGIYDTMSQAPKEFHIIADAPHFLSWTHSSQINKLTADFLDGITEVESMGALGQGMSSSDEKSTTSLKKWFTQKTSQSAVYQV